MFQQTSLTPATSYPAIAVAKAPLAARVPAAAPLPRHAHWRAAAFSIFAEDSHAQGPFSLWPRLDAAAKAPKPTAGSKKKGRSSAEEAEELEGMSNPSLGKQRFRSALEQVSVYTNDAAFRSRD